MIIAPKPRSLFTADRPLVAEQGSRQTASPHDMPKQSNRRLGPSRSRSVPCSRGVGIMRDRKFPFVSMAMAAISALKKRGPLDRVEGLRDNTTLSYTNACTLKSNLSVSARLFKCPADVRYTLFPLSACIQARRARGPDSLHLVALFVLSSSIFLLPIPEYGRWLTRLSFGWARAGGS